ncbi:hypothetical protein [Agreia pratensis]|uniref:Uncharacterized protein n=1 Tax=Agreia pratensis TaxID=150121 RepID=A0A1X7JI27_9MICO|nr:hypothetical protein [Agreia pratensis]SMG27394.1 hypothetical protein SAMN06296010_1416 [Agreia pratensis]
MPSYRFSAAIGALRPGVAAARLLPELTDDARTLAIVEASSIAVVRGEARVVIRFTGEDDQDARNVALGIFSLARELAQLSTPELTRRVKNKWIAVSDE